MSNHDVIHIFYACDENFVKYTIVSIASMMENAARDRRYHIHILHTDIPTARQDTLLRMQDMDFTITFDNVTPYLHSIKGQMPLRDYYSKTTYYRLFIAEMFPDLEKAIYIDSDTVVQGNIAALYDVDVSRHLVAACHEQAMVQTDVYGTYVEKCLGIDRNNYFNAGVLLINCRAFREERVLKQFMELLGFYNFTVTQDEDYLNVICCDRVLFLPQVWNMEVYGEITTPAEDFCVIHYIMVAKPWHFADCRYGDIFWSYAAKTSVYGEIVQVLDNYTDEQRAASLASGDRLAALALSESEREDNYLARVRAAQEQRTAVVRDEGRVRILEKIAAYEREGRFDEDVEDDPPGRSIEPDEVDYLGEKLSSRLQCKLAFAAARAFVYRLLRKKQMIVKEIRGSEHIAALQSGAVMTCNHFNAFDSFAIQLAYESGGQQKKRKFYRVIKEGNYTSFPGFYGYLMRHCNTLPLSTNPRAMKQFLRATDRLLKAGHFVLIYPEQSMWWNYRKPKPLKDGGFYFAAKAGVPALPCFITMQDSEYIGADGFPVQEYTVHIAPPILPDPHRSVSENTAWMKEENYRVWKEIYEQTYGIPLAYTTEKVNIEG